VIFLRQADAQGSVYGLNHRQSRIYFLGELMDGLDIRTTICFASVFLPASKRPLDCERSGSGSWLSPDPEDNQQPAKNPGRLHRLRARVPSQRQPIVETEAMLALAFFKNLNSRWLSGRAGASGDGHRQSPLQIRLGSPHSLRTLGITRHKIKTTRKTPIAAARPRQASGNDQLGVGPAD
jgi:hypothetical protein